MLTRDKAFGFGQCLNITHNKNRYLQHAYCAHNHSPHQNAINSHKYKSLYSLKKEERGSVTYPEPHRARSQLPSQLSYPLSTTSRREKNREEEGLRRQREPGTVGRAS